MYPRLSPTMMIGWVWLKLMWFKRAWTLLSLLLFNSNKPVHELSRYSILVIISIDLAMKIFSTMIVKIVIFLLYSHLFLGDNCLNTHRVVFIDVQVINVNLGKSTVYQGNLYLWNMWIQNRTQIYNWALKIWIEEKGDECQYVEMGIGDSYISWKMSIIAFPSTVTAAKTVLE